jgi:single-strand DNA-binding protein
VGKSHAERRKNMALNVFTIQGRCVATPEVRQVTNVETPFREAKYRLAVPRNYKNKGGEYPTDFFVVRVVNGAADYAAKNFKPGMWITASGRLFQEPYEKDGVKCVAHVLHAACQYPVYQAKKLKEGEQVREEENESEDGFLPAGDEDPFAGMGV